MAFDISQQVKVVNPMANVDYYYGTYASIAKACASVPYEIRKIGKTVGIETDNGVVEYWWKNGIGDKDLIIKGGQGPKGEDGKDGTFTHSYNEDTQTLSFSNTPLDSLTTIKIDVTKLIYDYLDGNISGDGELMEYSAIADYINVSKEKFIHIVKNLVSNIVLLELKEDVVEDYYQYLNYFSHITNMEINGGKDLDEGLINITASIGLTNIFEYIEEVQQAYLVFKVVGKEPLKVRWYIEIIRNN